MAVAQAVVQVDHVVKAAVATVAVVAKAAVAMVAVVRVAVALVDHVVKAAVATVAVAQVAHVKADVLLDALMVHVVKVAENDRLPAQLAFNRTSHARHRGHE